MFMGIHHFMQAHSRFFSLAQRDNITKCPKSKSRATRTLRGKNDEKFALPRSPWTAPFPSVQWGQNIYDFAFKFLFKGETSFSCMPASKNQSKFE